MGKCIFLFFAAECLADHFYCASESICMSNDYLCDGEVDCEGGQDEECDGRSYNSHFLLHSNNLICPLLWLRLSDVHC